jgi:hypothetical protein
MHAHSTYDFEEEAEQLRRSDAIRFPDAARRDAQIIKGTTSGIG